MADTIVRSPAVAGRFYPDGRAALERELDRCSTDRGASARLADAPRSARAVMAPHAGYHYSGAVAAQVFDQVHVPARVVVLSPNHTGRGAALSIFPPGGVWETPLGDVEIDDSFTAALLDSGAGLTSDQDAHRDEHGVEVELPFLQRARQRAGGDPLRLTALVLRTRDAGVLARIGAALADAIAAADSPVLLVASTDMNHFDADAETRRKDELALARVVAKDPAGLLVTCREHAISMCGAGPTAAVLYALERAPDALPVTRIDYRTSGDAGGSRSSVVGYASAILG